VTVNGLPAAVGRTFADVGAGALVVYVDSGGHVAVACNRGSAVQMLNGRDRVVIIQG
jgi:S-adenosylmethionine hydrolase